MFIHTNVQWFFFECCSVLGLNDILWWWVPMAKCVFCEKILLSISFNSTSFLCHWTLIVLVLWDKVIRHAWSTFSRLFIILYTFFVSAHWSPFSSKQPQSFQSLFRWKFFQAFNFSHCSTPSCPSFSAISSLKTESQILKGPDLTDGSYAPKYFWASGLGWLEPNTVFQVRNSTSTGYDSSKICVVFAICAMSQVLLVLLREYSKFACFLDNLKSSLLVKWQIPKSQTHLGKAISMKLHKSEIFPHKSSHEHFRYSILRCMKQ